MEDLEKKFYKINQVAEIVGIQPSTLRYWETQFSNVLKPKRSEKGTRYYTAADIDKVRMINFLVRKRGIRIEKAQEMIRHNHSGVTKRYEAMERLKSVRDQLAALLASIDSTNR